MVNNIMEKYCNGELGIDCSSMTKYCVFHNRILKLIERGVNNENIISSLIQNNFVNNLCQFLEEGVLNIITNINNMDIAENDE